MTKRRFLSIEGLRRVVVLLGVLVLGFIALGTAWQLWQSYEQALRAARQRGEVLAEGLEAQVQRAVLQAHLVLRGLSEATVQGAALPSAAQLQRQGRGLGHLALLDERGKVVASSRVGELGQQLGLDVLPTHATLHPQLLGLHSGRGLADWNREVSRAELAASNPVLPLVLCQATSERLCMVLSLDVDALLAHPQGLIRGNRAATWLASFEGELLSVSSSHVGLLGQSLAANPVFATHLPLRAQGSYQGPGQLGSDVLVSYRSSLPQPLVVAVEQPLDQVLEHWRSQVKGQLLLSGLIALLVVWGTSVVSTSLRARARVEQALEQAHGAVARQSLEMSVLLTSVQELIFRTDPRGVLSFVNARWGAVSALVPEQALGLPLAQAVGGAAGTALVALFGRDDSARSAETQVCGVDGALRRYLFAVVPLRRDGVLVGFAGSGIDVTERHQAQERLRQQLGFTELLLEISPLPISLTNAVGHYVTVNRAWEDFTGHVRAEVIGRPAAYFLPPQQQRLNAEEDRRVCDTQGRLRYETQLRHRDGSLRDMLVTKVAVPDAQRGTSMGVLCTLMDVSEFRAAERATVQARDAAEEASRAKTEFIANISHELRTPLQAILGFSELGHARSQEHQRLASMFGDINAAGQRMLAMVNDLLDVSKIDSPQGSLRLERQDLRRILREAAHELTPLLEQRHLRLRWLLTEQALDVRADPLRMMQVLRNVLANAIKFSPAGGEIDIEGSHDYEQVVLRVADQGPGIPEAELEHIFDAFVQSSGTKDGSGGTGLGLTISRKILTAHGGSIQAANREQGGAVFEIRLPAAFSAVL
ncbi:ATP-binding protein [Roseateles sp. BYS180W]|uniref:histidine kinase n=1 Tax=Roseateles rivi TaxID=3299028 RepID=A0ABW7FQY7_9BURK